MLRKRSLIETVNDQLENVCQIELDPPSMLTELHHQSVIYNPPNEMSEEWGDNTSFFGRLIFEQFLYP